MDKNCNCDICIADRREENIRDIFTNIHDIIQTIKNEQQILYKQIENQTNEIIILTNDLKSIFEKKKDFKIISPPETPMPAIFALRGEDVKKHHIIKIKK